MIDKTTVYITTQRGIPLGYQGENKVREIVFPQPAELLSETWTLFHRRAQDAEPYPVPLDVTARGLVWTVAAGDTDISGTGRAQLICTGADGEVLKTCTYSTTVSKSLHVGGEPPDPVKPWFDAIMDAIASGGGTVDEETIRQVVAEYIEENPVEAGATEEQARQIAENTEAIARLDDQIPTKTSELDNDSGFLTQHQSLEDYAKTKDLAEVAKSGSYADLHNRPTIPTVPTKVSAFTNDAGYLTQHQDISGKLDASKLPEAVDDALAQAKASGAFDGQPGTPGKNGDPGTPGKDGITPTIGSNGNWFLESTDTGKPSRGAPGTPGTPGKDGDPGKTPVKGVDYWTEADKQEILDSLEAAIAGVPGYWKAALDTGVQAINTALCTAGANKSAFLFYSDAHWDYGSQMSPTLLKYLYQHTGITKTFFGGDIVNDEGTDYDTMEYLWDWRHQLKDLLNHHSVVGNHDDGNSTNNLFSEAYIYGYLLAPEETPDIVREEKGLWYYMDSPAEKTRYLFLDTAYKGATDAQLDFVKAALLDTPEKWHIVGIAHIWYDPDYDQYDQRPVPIKGLNADASKIITLLDAYNSRTGDYASCGGWVEFCIGGHCHYDYDGTTTTGIPIALVETDSKHLRDTQTFTAGTTTESSVNGIVADYTNRSLHIIRVGRGKSRDVTLPASSAMMTYTNVLGTVGYVENKRLSPSSGYIEKDGDTDLTGFIPVNAGDIIFMKNVVMPSTDTTGYANMAYLFDSSKAGINGIHLTVSQADMGVVADASGNVVQFTVTQKHLTETSGYLRIGATDINAASIITVNEPIG